MIYDCSKLSTYNRTDLYKMLKNIKPFDYLAIQSVTSGDTAIVWMTASKCLRVRIHHKSSFSVAVIKDLCDKANTYVVKEYGRSVLDYLNLPFKETTILENHSSITFNNYLDIGTLNDN